MRAAWLRIPPLFVDTALAAVFVVSAQIELRRPVDDGYQAGPMWLNIPLVLLMTAPLAWRRVRPTWCFCVMVAAAALPGISVAHTVFFWGSMVPIAIATYSVARHRDTTLARQAWLVGPVLVAANQLHVEELRSPSNILFSVGLFGVAWLIGRVLHRLAVQQQALEAALERLAEEQAFREEAAADAERRRIGAEIHDVVSHSVSLMTLQVGAARLGIEQAGGQVPDQLAAAERTGRQALTELRRALLVLRAAGEHGSREPLPDLDAVPSLVRNLEDAGLTIELDLRLHPGLQSSVQLTLYRIVQEALTNVLRHAGPVHVRVVMHQEEDRVRVEVRNQRGHGGASAEPGGHGLPGMRQRVAMFGGELVAEPTEDGGFVVRAVVPVDLEAIAQPEGATR